MVEILHPIPPGLGKQDFFDRLERCVETAQAVLAAQREAGRTPEWHVDERLIECGYGDWTGKAIKDLAKDQIKGAAVNNLLKVALLAGNGPDIVQTSGPSYLTGIANAGHLLPLDDFAARYKWKERFLPTLLNTGVYSDKLYALPRDYESMHLFYNKQLFSQNGWEADWKLSGGTPRKIRETAGAL